MIRTDKMSNANIFINSTVTIIVVEILPGCLCPIVDHLRIESFVLLLKLVLLLFLFRMFIP